MPQEDKCKAAHPKHQEEVEIPRDKKTQHYEASIAEQTALSFPTEVVTPLNLTFLNS